MKYYIKEDKGYVLKKNDGLTAKKLHQCSRCLFRGKKIEPKKPLFLKMGEKMIQIVVDYDGNKKVREEINRYTSLKVSYGEDINNVKNCVITHIWGEAKDPRYFSFMWNFCITPSFAASLTDKNDDSESTIAGNLRNKLKMIASKLYSNIEFKGGIWDGFESPFNSECSDSLNGIKIKLIQGKDVFEICTFTDGGKYKREKCILGNIHAVR